MRWREFALVYVAYMGFLVSRKNYGFWLRPVISELGYATHSPSSDQEPPPQCTECDFIDSNLEALTASMAEYVFR